MTQKIKQISTGFSALFVGLSLIRRNPRILKLAIIPFILDFIVLVGVFAWGSQHISGWMEKMTNWFISDNSGFVWQLLYWPLYALGWLAFLASLFFLGYVAASLIASPFNSLLAETTLEELKVIRKRQFHFGRWVGISIRMLWAGLLKTVLFLTFGVVFFLVSFIPMLGLVASFGMLLIMAFDSADYSFEIVEFTLKRRLQFFRDNLFFFMGSGLALGLTLMIPGLNFLLFPAAVVGGADLVRKRLAAEQGMVKYEYTGSGAPAHIE